MYGFRESGEGGGCVWVGDCLEQSVTMNMKLVSPRVLVLLKFEPQVMGQIVGPLKTDR